MYVIYGPTFMPTPRTFEKVLMDPIRPNVSKNVVKKCKKNIFFKPLFGTLPKIGDWIRKYVQIRHGF